MEGSAQEQIDAIIRLHEGWKGDLLSQIRSVVLSADESIVEEVKWKMPTRPEGLPVWSHDGILCFAETWKDNIKLLFPKGAHFQHASKLFNARLLSKDIRAIEFRAGDSVDKSALTKLVREALVFNAL